MRTVWILNHYATSRHGRHYKLAYHLAKKVTALPYLPQVLSIIPGRIEPQVKRRTSLKNMQVFLVYSLELGIIREITVIE